MTSQDKIRQKWARIMEQVGVAGARIVRHRSTDVGEQVTVEVPGDATNDLTKKRVELAMGGRRGSVRLAQDKGNARTTIHTMERDPWADAAPLHPVLLVADEMTQYTETARGAGEEGRR